MLYVNCSEVKSFSGEKVTGNCHLEIKIKLIKYLNKTHSVHLQNEYLMRFCFPHYTHLISQNKLSDRGKKKKKKEVTIKQPDQNLSHTTSSLSVFTLISLDLLLLLHFGFKSDLLMVRKSLGSHSQKSW